MILNLGCGTKTSADRDVINIDWSFYLRIKRMRFLSPFLAMALSPERRERLRSLPDNILVHDLAKGIPFPDGSADAAYHSHLLEHLDRDVAPRFLSEIQRVLRPGGTVRIVVPDLERSCREYLDHLARVERHPEASATHEEYVAAIIEQLVRREGRGTAEQTGIRRVVDRLLLGDARQRGETHRWMYDRVTLEDLLLRVGFIDIARTDYRTSRIPEWDRYGLDRNSAGGEYKPGSLYMEATKPRAST
jgi:SAM-dependent methyltransferase